jgi:cytochrome c oxidase subunit 2
VLALAAAGCSGANFFAPDPASEQGDQILSLWRVAFVAALIVGGIVYALIVFAVIRYRRRGDDVPGQREYNVPVEIVYTVIPILIVAALFVLQALRESEVNALSDDPDLVVEVVGFQWQWQFTYVDEGVRLSGEPNERLELVLPVDRTIRFDLQTRDVVHSFWVPEFLEKRDLIPGIDNQIDITPTREGTFTGRCAEFCGLDHWRMTFSVRVVSGEEFDDWLADQTAAEATP